jgi:hypothetical protein
MHAQAADRWRTVSFVLGLLAIIAALDSPIDALAVKLFWVHMVQHILLIAVAPPLLALARPWTRMWRGLPLEFRRRTARALTQEPRWRPLRRAWALIGGLGLEVIPNPLYDAYYGLIDFEFWARKNIGEEAVEYLKKNVHPLDLAFRLAEDRGIVLLNGGGFEAPDWSLRVSLANLDDEVYEEIGRGVRAIARGYRDAHEAAKRAERTRKAVA